MRSDSDLFVLLLLDKKDWVTTDELRTALLDAIRDGRDPKRPFRFGFGYHDGIGDMLLSFAAFGWVEGKLPPGDPDLGQWKISDFGRQVLAKAQDGLIERLGFLPAVSKT